MKYRLVFTLLLMFSEIAFGQECLCGKNGYGSKEGDLPEFIFTFSDSTKIAFCGHVRKKDSNSSFIMSEFNVFTCDSADNILGYSAVHSCSIFFRNDSLFIDRLIMFPNETDKEWVSLPLSQTTISSKNGSLNVSNEEIILEFPNTLNYETKSVLSKEFKQMNYEDISVYLGQITKLAIEGDENATEILFSEKLEDHCDGAVAQHLKDCKEIYKWVVNGEKDYRHWW